jgi:hypothetical protein
MTPGGNDWLQYNLNNTIFWGVMPCTSAEVHKCVRNKQNSPCCQLCAGYLVDLIFVLENEGSTIFDSIGELLPDISHPGRWYSSVIAVRSSNPGGKMLTSSPVKYF